MAKIGQFTSGVATGVPGVSAGPRATPAAFGDSGEGFAAIAKSLGQVSEALQEAQLRKDELEYHKTISQGRIDFLTRADELSLEAPEDIVKTYNEEFEKLSSQLTIPNSMRGRAAQDLDNLRVSFINKGIQAGAARAGAQAKNNWEQIVIANSNAVLIDPTMEGQSIDTLRTAVAGLQVDSATRDRLLSDGIQDIRSSVALAAVNNNPAQFLTDAKAGEFGDLESLPKFIQSAEVKVKQQEAAIKKQIREDVELRVFQTSDFEKEIAIDQEELLSLKDSGQLEIPNYIKASKNLESSLKKREDDILGIQLIHSFDNGELLFNPGDADHAKAANVFYQRNVLPQIEGLEPQDQIRAKVDYVREHKYIPELLKSEIETNLTNGSNDSKVTASNIMTDIVTETPEISRQFSDSDLAFAFKVTESVNAGLSANSAVEFAETQTLLKASPEYKARLNQHDADKKDFKRSNVQQFFRNDPEDIPASMQQEWETLYRFNRVQEGVNDKKSQELAYIKLQSTWGVSSLTGAPKWEKFAPEAYYSLPGVSDQWMRKQLKGIVLDHNTMFENIDSFALEKFINENVQVIPDMRTVRSNKPAYQILQTRFTDDGGVVMDTIRDANGNELFWIPDFSETTVAQKMQEKQNKNMEQITASFEKQRERNRKLVKDFGFLPNEAHVLTGPEGRQVVGSIREGF